MPAMKNQKLKLRKWLLHNKSKDSKIVRNKFNRRNARLEHESYKTSLKEITEDLSKWRAPLVGISSDSKESACLQETWVQSLGQEDLLEKAVATHSSILAWKIPQTEERGRLQSMRSQRVRHDWVTSLSKDPNPWIVMYLLVSDKHI